MRQIALISRRADAFCARLNAGLFAVAVALAVLTGAMVAVRFPPPMGAESGLWAFDPADSGGANAAF
jgi:hypothetical protein